MNSKVLRVIPSMDPRSGGTVEAVRQGAISLAEFGITTEVLCNDAQDSPWLKDSDLCVHAVGAGQMKFGFNKGMSDWLRDHCGSYSAVIVDGLWQYHGYATWRQVRGRVPYYVFVHGMLDPWFRSEYPLKHIKKSAYWRLIEHKVLRDADGVIFTCEEEMKLARDSFRPYRVRERTATLGISAAPVDLPALRDGFLRKWPQLNGKRIALFLGRIHEKKGCDLLVEAFAAIAREQQDLALVIAGPQAGAFGEQLRARCESLSISDRVTWTGMLQHDAKWGALAAAEVFCLPSHQENFGIAVVEALAAGTPVLISDKINIWPQIQQEGAGIVAADSVEGTEASLRKWLSLTGEERAATAGQAKRCYLSHYTPDVAGQELARILQEHGK